MADTPTLSGVPISEQTAGQVEKVKAAMAHAGKEPPEAIVMLLEVIGRETEKREQEGNDLFGGLHGSLLKSASRILPFQAGTDFEFIIQPKDPKDEDSPRKALEALDQMMLGKIKREFSEVRNIDNLRLETVAAYMKAHREWREGDTHTASSRDVMNKFSEDKSTFGQLDQYGIMSAIADVDNGKKLSQLAGNHIYPGDLVIQLLEEQEKASGEHTIVAGWPPNKRHEAVSREVAQFVPDLAKYGRFEAATAHEGKTPLEMLHDYYESFGKMNDIVDNLAAEKGIHFNHPLRLTDHVHISNERDMVLNSSTTIKKAAGVVDTMDAMVALLTADSNFEDEAATLNLNPIKVNKIGYASDGQFVMYDERGYALRGVRERTGAGETPYGHFEARMGDSHDPFSIVSMTGALTIGLNRSNGLDPDIIATTEDQYRSKGKGTMLSDITAKDAFARLVFDPRLDVIPDKARAALLGWKLELMKDGAKRIAISEYIESHLPDALPKLDHTNGVPATEEALRATDRHPPA